MLDTFWLIVILYIVALSLYFSKKINYKNYKIKKLTKKINTDNLFLSLGTKMGVGTLIGTTMSIYIGGPSSILWIIIFTFLTSSLIYAESTLGYKYKQKNGNSFISGIYFYTKYGLKKNKLAFFMLILFLSTYSFFFLMIQANTISSVLNINKIILITIFLFFIIMIITNDLTEIRKVLNKIVPVMCVFFLSISVYAILKNIKVIPYIISTIFKNALNLKSLFTGMIIGIKRSVFLNELLIGTSSMSSGINNEDTEIIANTLILGSYFVIIISTLISLLLLIYIYNTQSNPTNYMNLLIETFTYHFNTYGNYFLCLLICLLGTSSIISGIYIGKSNITCLFNNKTINSIFNILIFIFTIVSLLLKIDLIWKLVDVLLLILITLNSLIITKLKSSVF